jgi:hypothetical protein
MYYSYKFSGRIFVPIISLSPLYSKRPDKIANTSPFLFMIGAPLKPRESN